MATKTISYQEVVDRVSPQLHAAIATRAAAAGKSLNQWAADALDQSVHEY